MSAVGDARKRIAEVSTPDAGTDVDGRPDLLRSIANSIEPAFPSAADLLRGMAREMSGHGPPSAPDAEAVIADPRTPMIVALVGRDGSVMPCTEDEAASWLAAHDAALIAAAEARGGSFLIGHQTVTRQDYLAFTSAIGFGDDVTEPAARPDEMLDAVEQAFSEASEHRECPVICEPCGERLAATTCEHCHGSGGNVGLIEATLAYSECEWCAGVGKVHEGCVEKSYADLVAEVAAAEARGAAEAGERIADVVTEFATAIAPAYTTGREAGAALVVFLRMMTNLAPTTTATDRTEATPDA